MKAGIAGQLCGPFNANQDLMPFIQNGGQLMQLGISIDTKDAMCFGGENDGYLTFEINGEQICMGRTNMYEIGNPSTVRVLKFKEDAPASVKINYLTYES